MARQSFKTYERTTTSVKDYKFDLAPLTNGRDGATTDYLQSGETINTYAVTSSDVDLVIDSDSKADSDTSVVVWVSGGDITDSVYYIDLHVVTTDGREDDFTIRLIPIQRKGVD